MCTTHLKKQQNVIEKDIECYSIDTKIAFKEDQGNLLTLSSKRALTKWFLAYTLIRNPVVTYLHCVTFQHKLH